MHKQALDFGSAVRPEVWFITLALIGNAELTGGQHSN